MRRREFIRLIGGAVAFPIAARAQESKKKFRIGTLGFAAIPPAVGKAFKNGIEQLVSQEVIIEHRHAEGRPELFSERATQLVRINVAVIFARGPQALLAARDATTTIPIVGVDFESDPVAMGFVQTLAHPGGNITGVFLDLPELGGKQMELLREVFPQITRVAIMGDPGINATQFSATENAARVFGIQPEAIAVRVLRDFETALENAASNQAEAGVLLSSPLVFGHMREVVALITAKRFPVISLFSEFPRTGGFMAYGPSVPESFRRCGSYVGRILQGAKPSELPIERPERFELVVNTRTAKTFGITVPSLVLARADEVIE
jgi:ABC-type uncharacterized transport system substrate-binding protein